MPDLKPLLQVSDLKTHYDLPAGELRAVNGASLSIGESETVGVVGESGCGKSVMLRSILGIVPRPGRVIGGSINFQRKDGSSVDITALDRDGAEIRAIRGAEISMVFQEPMTSLSPVHRIGDQIAEAIEIHHEMNYNDARKRAEEMLRQVSMPRPEKILDQYPHEISGGMRQRAMIAMALSCSPRLLLADEPTTALDVTTQAQILDTMRRLQKDNGMAILFVTHDLGVVAQIARKVVVMYLGQVVESGPVRDVYFKPKHPYTHALLHSVPRPGQRSSQSRLKPISGHLPDPFKRLQGCPFRSRCNFADDDLCAREMPDLKPTGDGRQVRCHYSDRLDLEGLHLAERSV